MISHRGKLEQQHILGLTHCNNNYSVSQIVCNNYLTQRTINKLHCGQCVFFCTCRRRYIKITSKHTAPLHPPDGYTSLLPERNSCRCTAFSAYFFSFCSISCLIAVLRGHRQGQGRLAPEHLSQPFGLEHFSAYPLLSTWPNHLANRHSTTITLEIPCAKYRETYLRFLSHQFGRLNVINVRFPTRTFLTVMLLLLTALCFVVWVLQSISTSLLYRATCSISTDISQRS